jgi:hypothetical protein
MLLLPSPEMISKKYASLVGKKVKRRERPFDEGFPFA